MFSFRELIAGAFTPLPKPVTREEHEQAMRQARRRIVMQFARGNLALQSGRILTEKDVDNLRKEVLSHRF